MYLKLTPLHSTFRQKLNFAKGEIKDTRFFVVREKEQRIVISDTFYEGRAGTWFSAEMGSPARVCTPPHLGLYQSCTNNAQNTAKRATAEGLKAGAGLLTFGASRGRPLSIWGILGRILSWLLGVGVTVGFRYVAREVFSLHTLQLFISSQHTIAQSTTPEAIDPRHPLSIVWPSENQLEPPLHHTTS